VLRLVVGDALPCPLARGDECEVEPGMRRDQRDELRTDVAARADQADLARRAGRHGDVSRLKSRCRRTIGHSSDRIENTTVSR
jgi:hypothetical protein